MSMVVCNGCRQVVWAYDHETRPVAGILNLMKMPCGKCGAVANFDGWDGDLSWEVMHKIAETLHYDWAPDDQNRWFGDLTEPISLAVRYAAKPVGDGPRIDLNKVLKPPVCDIWGGKHNGVHPGKDDADAYCRCTLSPGHTGLHGCLPCGNEWRYPNWEASARFVDPPIRPDSRLSNLVERGGPDHVPLPRVFKGLSIHRHTPDEPCTAECEPPSTRLEAEAERAVTEAEHLGEAEQDRGVPT